MTKNIQWDIKTKIKTALIMFITIFVGIFYESVSRDWTSSKMIITQVAASAAFAALVAFTVDAKACSLKSAKGIATLVMIAYVFAVIVSRNFFKHEALLMLVFAPLLLICSQVTLLMPVAAVISWFIALKHGGVAVMCMPAVVGASLVCLSAQVKDSPVWKKILFAVSEFAVIAAAVFSIYNRRYFLITYALITDIWDSLGIIATVAIFIALAVVSIKKKRSVGEIFGYIASSALAIVIMFMNTDYSLTASCAMLMAVPVICQGGLPAEEIGDKALKTICEKLKK